MDCPDPLDLALATPSQLSSPLNGLAGLTQRHDTPMGRGIGDAASVFACGLGELYALALPLVARLIVVFTRLQLRQHMTDSNVCMTSVR